MPALNLSVITRKNRFAKGCRAKYRHLDGMSSNGQPDYPPASFYLRQAPADAKALLRNRFPMYTANIHTYMYMYIRENRPNYHQQLNKFQQIFKLLYFTLRFIMLLS